MKNLQRDWDEFGRTDPLWAILASPDTRGGKWDVDAFFETGRAVVSKVMKDVGSLEVDLPRRSALDFGCGVGRLTRALADHFDEVVGVDIAPSMVELARKYAGADGRCSYVVNSSDDLRIFADGRFDLVYSNLVLQHMPRATMRRYFGEFLRIAARDGLVVFELSTSPSVPRQVWSLARRAQRRVIPSPILLTYWMKPRDVRAFFEQRGASVLDARTVFKGRGMERVQYCIRPPAA
jgi:ubiquinone/menaquinone biosynthesis C-methylase UbiE